MNWLERAMAVTPLGSQTRSKGPAAYGIGNVPHFANRGYGAHIEEINRSMLDWTCGLGSISLGYRHPHVDEAIKNQLIRGILFSLPSYLEIETAERLRDIIPCMKGDGMARFLKTGSEACEAAVRIARKATGRDMILVPKTGYHGWHSFAQAWKDNHPGVPSEYEELTRAFTYNDLDSVDCAFNKANGHVPGMNSHGGVAAILLEPTLFEYPTSAFLEGLRERAANWGAVLIFDEMVTGFRLSRAGGQERFGVVPDISCFGKGMANGMPLSVVCGKRELMEHADVVSGTFGGECLSLAACNAVLDVYEETDVCGHMAAIGKMVNDGFMDAARAHDVGIDIIGWPEVSKFTFQCDPSVQNKALGLFTQEMAKRGILWHPRIKYVSLAHTEQDVQQTVEAAHDSFAAVKHALYYKDWSALVGQPPDEPFARKG